MLSFNYRSKLTLPLSPRVCYGVVRGQEAIDLLILRVKTLSANIQDPSFNVERNIMINYPRPPVYATLAW